MKVKGCAKRRSAHVCVAQVGAAALTFVVGCSGGRLPDSDPGAGQGLIACGAGATIAEVEIPRDGA